MLKFRTKTSPLKILLLAVFCCLLSNCSQAKPKPRANNHSSEKLLIEDARQLTFVGRRNGEGYFSADSEELVFQGERSPDNPFYQIFTLDLTSNTDSTTAGPVQISDGHSKTTCAWFDRSGENILYSSTAHDVLWENKKKAELEARSNEANRRYSWDYDLQFELYSYNRASGKRTRITHSLGYDAEASWSPDGNKILFASNRLAYAKDLTVEEKKLLASKPEHFIDLFVMNSDGSNVQQLTTTAGYDGGPFFSADGTKIVWRRFTANGMAAEIWTMNSDGSDKRQITSLDKISWAPFFHPSGDYIVFSTNVHGFKNFELYIVDSLGSKEPKRVTYTDGFDGLPVFSPNGEMLSWTSTRSSDGSSQLFLGKWNDKAARSLLGIVQTGETTLPASVGTEADKKEISQLKTYVEVLSSEKMQGRLTGFPGEKRATLYAAHILKEAGFSPAGDNGTFYQNFEFTAGVRLGEGNALKLLDRSLLIEKDWSPLSFSQKGAIEESPLAFIGYGIKAPKVTMSDGTTFGAYDSYVHSDVKDKWVVALRFAPSEVDSKVREHLAHFSSLRFKAMLARENGAKGIIFVSGPLSDVKKEIIPLQFDASLSSSSLGVISVSNQIAADLLNMAGKDLRELNASLDRGVQLQAFDIPRASISGNIDIISEKKNGRNVLGRLPANLNFKAPKSKAQNNKTQYSKALYIGAHIDHLGRGKVSGSRARPNEEFDIHHGADDNASGVAAALVAARRIAQQQKEGSLVLKRDLVVALWSGEELGLLGSSHFAKYADPPIAESAIAYINLDMVGRLRDSLVIQGLASAEQWPELLERANIAARLSLTLQNDTYLPTDATTFYLANVPMISAFTGAHEDYHRPSDTADKINYRGLADITSLVENMSRIILSEVSNLDYVRVEKPKNHGSTSGLRAYLGTIPDYSQGDIGGVRISGVSAGAPAEKAGIQGGDIITALAGKKVENIYDYTFAIGSLKIGEEVGITVLRDGKPLELRISAESRQ